MLGVVAKLFVMIIALFVLSSLAVGGLAFFRTRKWLNTIRDQMSGNPQKPRQNDANIIEGEYKVLDNDEKKP